MSDTRTDLKTAQQCRDAMYAKDLASQAMGIDISVDEPGTAVASMVVRKDMINGFDVCHGGFVFALADTAFAFACNAYDQLTLAGAASIDYLQPVYAGDRLVARAVEVFRGGRTGVYSIEVHNQDDVLVALFRGRGHATSRALLDAAPNAK